MFLEFIVIIFIYFTKWFFWFFSELNNETRLHARNTQRQTDEKKKYNKTAVCSQSQRSRRRRRCFSVVTFSYTFSGLRLCVCVSVCAYMCVRVRVQRKMYETEREYVAQSKCSDNTTTQHCVKRRRRRQQQLSAAGRQSQTCGSVCVLRLYAWECAQQKQQQKKFRLWKIKHIHICTYVVCMRAAWLAADTVRERVRATICITFVRRNSVARWPTDANVRTLTILSHSLAQLLPLLSLRFCFLCHWRLLFMQFCYCLCRGT